MIFNAHHDALDFTLQAARWATEWGVVLDTNEEGSHRMREDDIGRSHRAEETFPVPAWSIGLPRRTAW